RFYPILLGEEYDHDKHRLPLGIMKAIRPVFDELAHPNTLKKVINGGSQNSNEIFHAVLWSLAPKTRYATGVIIDLCAAIAVLSFNDGDQSILPVIAELTEFQDQMSNFDICYNALCNAFHKENVIMPPALVKILKPDDAIHSSITLTNTSSIDSDSDTTTNVDTDSSDESADSNDIDSTKSIQENINKGKNDDSIANAKTITRSLSSLTLTTNINPLNSSLSSLTLATNSNPLDLPRDRKRRQETFNKLNQLIFSIREQKGKTTKKEIYELPPLIKQIIRCLYPSDIDDKKFLQKPDVIFPLQTFIELFRI
ncbi:unnamed protein product, partial [Rotaria sordida]